MTRVSAIKKFFETPPHAREITRAELVELHKDKKGYEEIAQLCAEALGETIDKDTN